MMSSAGIAEKHTGSLESQDCRRGRQDGHDTHRQGWPKCAEAIMIRASARLGRADMRLLFINPNTSAHLTELGARVARGVARPETEIVPATGRFGARYITSRAAAAVAGHAVLDTYAREGKGADAVVIACFGDPGLFALRELATIPVVGMAEASCHLASTLGRKFSIVTGGHRWGPMLEEFVATIGLGANLASVRTMAPTGNEIA